MIDISKLRRIETFKNGIDKNLTDNFLNNNYLLRIMDIKEKGRISRIETDKL